MPLETLPFESAKYLTDQRDQAEPVAEAFTTGDGATIRHALDIVARARGISQVARDAGLARETPYKALDPEGDQRLSTDLGLLSALDVTLSADMTDQPEPAVETR